MKEIIEKAIEGGYGGLRYNGGLTQEWTIYTETGSVATESPFAFRHAVLDPVFWRTLSRVCKWGYKNEGEPDVPPQWLDLAKYFYELNLTEGWQKAVEYLKDITK